MDDKNYWNSFYSQSALEKNLINPSQFAAFVLGETSNFDTIIEFGCGNGRDSAFFARHGKKVFAFDLSTDVIEINKRSYSDIPDLSFQVCNAISEFSEREFNTKTAKAIYARFFIHALQTEDISHFFGNCAQLLSKNDRLFLEYRTIEDTVRQKATQTHFRNFLKMDDVETMLNLHGMKTSYLVHGVGFAKWKNDDAYVARHIVELV